MTKTFASTGDLADKAITFKEIGRDLYAFTAEGDPNSGIIVGDDGVIVVDAQATPALAGEVIARVRKITDKPIKYVVLSHYHAVRVLGASAYEAQEIIASRDLPRHDRRARQGGLGFRVRPLPAPVPRRRDHPGADLADPHLRAAHDALSGQAAGRAHAHRPRAYRGRHHRLGARRQRRVLRRHRRIQVGLLLRRCAFHRLAGDARAPRRLQGRRAGSGPRRGAGRAGMVAEGIELDARSSCATSTSRCKRGVARGASLKECFDAANAAMRPKYGSWPIFEHCQPFNVSRA